MMAEYDWESETYTANSGGDFIKEAAFNKLVYTDATVEIVDIREGVSTYNGREEPQWLVDFITADGEEFTKGLAKSNAERNARIERIKATLSVPGADAFKCRFIKVDRRFDIAKPIGGS